MKSSKKNIDPVIEFSLRGSTRIQQTQKQSAFSGIILTVCALASLIAISLFLGLLFGMMLQYIANDHIQFSDVRYALFACLVIIVVAGAISRKHG